MGMPRFAIIAAALVLLPLPSLAEDDAFTPFEDSSRSATELSALLTGSLKSLTGSGGSAAYGQGLYVCARGDSDARERLLADAIGLQTKAREILVGMGFKVRDEIADGVIVHVDATPPIAVLLPGRAILLRGPLAPAGGSAAEPAFKKRPDGPPLMRDVLPATRATRLWAASLRSRSLTDGESNTLRHFLADRIVAAADLPAATPPWFRAGLAAHVALALRPDAPPACPPGAPAGLAAGDRAAVDKLLGTDAPPAEAVPVLARLVGALVKGRTGLPALIVKLAAATDLPARGAVFGADLVALTAEAARPSATAPARAPSDGPGTVCPLCNGFNAGRLDIACGECGGTGGLACPSCMGGGECWAGCEKGTVTYEGGKKVRCKFCTGGNTSCVACTNKRRVPCLACGGKGKESRPCPACVKGRVGLPPPAGGAACASCAGKTNVPCSWCARGDFAPACKTCHGAGMSGCKECYGTLRLLCGDCDGTGESRMVYADGSQASVTKCGACKGRGFDDCRSCKGGKSACAACSGKGVVKADKSSCALCKGTGTAPCQACGPIPDAPVRAGAAESAEQNQVILDKALAFLLGSVAPDGSFALRQKGKDGVAGALLPRSIFSNSQTVWALIVAGVPRTDPKIEAAWRPLLVDIAKVTGGAADVGTQEAAWLLRAFLVGGGDPASADVTKLVALLAAAQRPAGLWNDFLDGTGDGDNILNSLIAIEALHVARTRGVKVPSAVWTKAYAAGSAAFGSRGPSKAATGSLDGIDVTSNLSLLVMAKAGMLGDKASSFDYMSIPDVKAGLAWLDRHMDITRVPVFVNGGYAHQDGGGCYFAWLFALQRLAMLLRIDEIGGENWHASGAAHLRELIRTDGSFEEKPPSGANWSVRSTTYAVLFLVRATVPVTEPGQGR